MPRNDFCAGNHSALVLVKVAASLWSYFLYSDHLKRNVTYIFEGGPELVFFDQNLLQICSERVQQGSCRWTLKATKKKSEKKRKHSQSSAKYQ